MEMSSTCFLAIVKRREATRFMHHRFGSKIVFEEESWGRVAGGFVSAAAASPDHGAANNGNHNNNSNDNNVGGNNLNHHGQQQRMIIIMSRMEIMMQCNRIGEMITKITITTTTT